MKLPKINRKKENISDGNLQEEEKEILEREQESKEDKEEKIGLLDKLKQLLNKKDETKNKKVTYKQRGLEIKLPGCDEYVPLGAWQYHKCYSDSLGKHLIIIIHEAAELLQAEGGRSAEAKEIAAMQEEITTCIKSLTQLGRSSCVSVVIATQRNDASVIPGVIQNNSLDIDTPIEVLRPIDDKETEPQNPYEKMKDFADSFNIPYSSKTGLIFESAEERHKFIEKMKIDASKYDESQKSLIINL